MNVESEVQLMKINKEGDFRKGLVHQYVIPISLEPIMETSWRSNILNLERILQRDKKDEGRQNTTRKMER